MRITLLLPYDFVVTAPCSFANGPSGRGLEGPSVSGKATVVPPDRRRYPTRAAIARLQHALLGFETAPLPSNTIRVEIHSPAARNHDRSTRVGEAAASARNHEHGPVHKPQPQLVNTVRSQLVALLLGRAKFDAAVLSGAARSLVRRLNGECVHQQR